MCVCVCGGVRWGGGGWKGENDRRKYFMINLHDRMLGSGVCVCVSCWGAVGGGGGVAGGEGDSAVYICYTCRRIMAYNQTLSRNMGT